MVDTAASPDGGSAGSAAGLGAAATRDPRRPQVSLFRWIAVGTVVATVLIGAAFGLRVGKDPTLVNSPLIGRPAPAATLPNLEGGGSLTLAALRGRVVVINFWASWCVPCRAEHRDLVAASAAYQNAGVTFVGVDFQDQRSSAVAFLDELGRGRGYRYVTDPDSGTALDFGVFGVPETYFLDRSGIVVAKITGGSTPSLLARTLEDILIGRTPGSLGGGPVQGAPGP